jgi:ubiquinone/menaquinone biosynthesis C-methylase UbiE
MNHGHKFEASGDWLRKLDGEKRRKAIPPEKIVEQLGLRRTDEVADLGAGVGYLAFPIAARAKSVVCIDIQDKMLEVLSDRIRDRGIRNMMPVRGDIQEPPLTDGSVDHLMAAFVFHEVDDPRLFVFECSRILRPGGTLTIVDFQKHAPIDFGPPEEERMAPEKVVRTCSTLFAERSRFEDPVYYSISFSKNG